MNQLEINIQQIKTSDDLTPFKKYSELLGSLTYNGTNCTQSAKSAFTFLSDCLNTIPKNCLMPTIPQNDIDKCNQSFESFRWRKFIKCSSKSNADVSKCYKLAKPKFSKSCKVVAEVANNVKSTKNICFDLSIMGSFSNCQAFVNDKISTIIGDCIHTNISNENNQIKTFFTEGDEVVEQTKSYNSVTKELTIHVPAHADRGAIDVIIGETKMITLHQRYCTFGDAPENVNLSLYEIPATRKFRATTPSLALNTSSIDTGYYFDVVDKYLSDEEKKKLPISFQDLCGTKPIKLISRLNVDESSFDNLNIFNGSSLGSVGRWMGRKPRMLQRMSKTSCFKTEKSCHFTYYNPDGQSLRITIEHHQVATVTCLACDTDQATLNRCKCDKISDQSSWNQCFHETTGDCSLVSGTNTPVTGSKYGGYSEWPCGDKCIPFTDKCDQNQKCYADLEECGNTGHCIPKMIPGLKMYSYWSCHGKCISEQEKCDGKCPDGFIECGDKCLFPCDLGSKYHACNGRCIPIGVQCEPWEWCYDEPSCNEEAWKTQVQFMCNGIRNSPINIDWIDEQPEDKEFPFPLKFTGYEKVKFSRLGNLVEHIGIKSIFSRNQISNKGGHTAQIDVDQPVANGVGELSGGPLKDPYQILQFHFHWGSKATTGTEVNPGSEHTYGGTQYLMEMHIVHIKKGLTEDNFSKYIDGLAVTGFMFEKGETENEALKPIITALNDITQYDHSIPFPPKNVEFNLNTLIDPAVGKRYATYQGGLTTPTCNEVVRWINMEEPLKITEDQLSAFWKLLNKDGKPIENNFRNVQDLGGRIVRVIKP